MPGRRPPRNRARDPWSPPFGPPWRHIFLGNKGVKTTIGNAAGLNHAVIQSNNFAFLASTYLDTQFIPSRAERGVFSFDFAILETPTLPNQQVVPGAPNGQDFVINTFSDSTARIWRFFTSHTGPTAGDMFMRLPGVTGEGTNIGTYTVGIPIHVEVNADYVHDTVNVYLDGTLAVANLPFTATRTGTNDQTTEFFIFNNGISGQMTITAIDNIFYAVVPEPSALLLCGLTAAGISVLIRRRR